MNGKEYQEVIMKKLNTVVGLLQHILAVQLYKSGVPQEAIAKHLHIGKTHLVEMVKWVKRSND